MALSSLPFPLLGFGWQHVLQGEAEVEEPGLGSRLVPAIAL